MVVSHAAAGFLSVLHGNGDGTLTLIEEAPAGAGCGPLAVGDLDGDGLTDIVAANQGGASLSILRAPGSGLGAVEVALPGEPVEPRLADSDRDGDLDVLVALESPAEVGWLRAHGDGTFDSYATLVPVSGSALSQLEVADLDLDGDIDVLVMTDGDVAVALADGNGGLGSMAFQSYPSDGPDRFRLHHGPMRVRKMPDGSTEVWVYASETVGPRGGTPWGDPPTYMISTWSAARGGNFIEMGRNPSNPVDPTFRLLELSGDGKADIVIGTGIHVEWSSFWPESESFGGVGRAAADLNGDSHDDLIGLACNFVTVALLHPVNDHAIQAGQGRSYGGGSQAAISFADVDQDGHVDAVALNGTSISVWQGRSDGTFGNENGAPIWAPMAVTALRLVTADVNGDGRPDLVAQGAERSAYGSLTATANLFVIPNLTGTSFGSPISFTNSSMVRTLATGDVDHDGRDDAVVVLTTGLSVVRGQPDATFTQGATYLSGPSLNGVALGDLDRDGNLDAVVSDYSDGISVLRGNGNGTFASPVHYAVPLASQVAVADLNGDGWLDVSVRTGSSLSTLLGSDRGLGSPFPALAGGVGGVALVDADADGRVDALLGAASCAPLRLALGRGDGTFQMEGTYARGQATVSTAVPLDEGATPDLLFATTDGFSVLRGLVTGTHTITAKANAGGMISPFGAVRIRDGIDRSFHVAPFAPRVIQDVRVDGVSVGPLQTYTFPAVAADHTIEATFAPTTLHTITASAGAGGTISPSGTVGTRDGEDQSFRITPSHGQAVQDVRIDGISVGPLPTYTFLKVAADHTIGATFGTSIGLDFAIDELMLGVPHMERSVPAYIEPSPPDTPDLLAPSTIRVQSQVPIDPEFTPVISDHDGDGRPELEVHFRRADLDALLPVGVRTVTVSGKISGIPFQSSDVVEVKHAKIRAPRGNQVVTMNEDFVVEYDVVPDAVRVDLLHSVDGGATWAADATEYEIDGAIPWHVPSITTGSALVAVAQVEWGSYALLGVLAVSEPFRIASADDPVVDPPPAVPSTVQLAPIVPTPSRGAVRLAFGLPRAARARLEVLDLSGRRVSTMLDGSVDAGWHEQVWRGETGGGHAAAGVYIVRLRAEGIEHHRRIVWMR